MKKEEIMRGDGNGGIVIKKWAFGAIISLLVLLGSVGGYVIGVENDITSLKTLAENNKEELDFRREVIQANSQSVAVINQRLMDMERTLERIEDKLNSGGIG